MADQSAFIDISQKISDSIVNQITNVFPQSIGASVTHTINIENINIDILREFKEEMQEPINTGSYEVAIEKIGEAVVVINDLEEALQKTEKQELIKVESCDVVIEKAGEIEGAINKVEEALQRSEKQEIIVDNYDGVIAKISDVEEAINRVGGVLEKIEGKSKDTGEKVKTTFEAVRDNIGSNFTAMGKGISAVGSIIDKVSSFGTKYLNKIENSKILKTADALSRTRTKLTALTGGQAEAGQFQERIFASAQNSGTSYESTANMVLGLNTKGSFANKEQAITFTELVNKSSVLGGASAEGTKGVQTAITEAMVSGKLSGAGFNSVLENAYPIIENIAAYLNEPIEAVQKMGVQGEISAEIIGNAMFASAQKTNDEFSKTPMTFEQLITSVKDKALMVFQPALQKISELTQNEDFMNMIQNMMNGLTFFGDLALKVVGVLTSVASTIVDNWSMIAPVILLIAAVFGIWKLSVLLSDFSIKKLTASLLSCPLFWIIGIIIAIVAIIKVVIDHINRVGDKTYTVAGVICGILSSIGAFVWNLLLVIGDIILGFINFLVNPFIKFANFIANLFMDPVSTVIYLFQGMADGVLGILESIANAMDFVFGGNLGETVAGWRSGLKDKADAAVQKYAPEENFGDKINYLNLTMESFGLEYVDYGEAWDKGNAFGDKINNLFKGSTGDKEDFSDTWDGILNNTEEIAEKNNGIQDNTEKIAHNTEIQPDDLSYLLELAERDAVNRFTTAEVKIDMGGVYNTVSSKQNLDGIVDYLTDKLREELNNTARACNA